MFALASNPSQALLTNAKTGATGVAAGPSEKSISIPLGPEKCISIPLGIVVRRAPGVTAWVKWTWTAIAVLPGAGPADWREIARDGEAIEYHAATVTLELFRTDTEAYLSGLSTREPAIYVVMRDGARDHPEVVLATVSPYDAQDYADSGDEMIDKVAMPQGLVDWIKTFISQHHEDEVFIKRKRDKHRIDGAQDGVGDARIHQVSDVYRAPRKIEVMQ